MKEGVDFLKDGIQKIPSGVRAPKDYSTIMARISPYASLAHKNEDIANLFDDFFEKAYSVKKNINNKMPLTISQQGQYVKNIYKMLFLVGNKN